MRILLIGGGGREHALAIALARSPRLSRLWIAPGNAGTAALGQNVTLTSNAEVVDFANENAIDLVVVGPEAPLVAGLADALTAAGISTFGPSAAAAQLEASKAFTKALCDRAGIPTAAYARFDTVEAALGWIHTRPVPIVVKADGLMAGKGVVVAATRAEAEAAVRDLGARGPLVIEECLTGTEASLFALVDGETVVPFGSARDYKRVGDGDRGPNTGGMGTLSPAPGLSPVHERDAFERIIRPAARAMAEAGTPFRGFLYAGLMLTAEGPKLIEFNVRLGDPEAQSLLPRLEDDLVDLLAAAASGRLPPVPPRFRQEAAVTVVVAARGYPEAPASAGIIRGLDAVARGAPDQGQVAVVHAGTARDAAGQLIATGGRVLGITAVRPSMQAARAAVYGALAHLDYADGFWRSDIGEPGVFHVKQGENRNGSELAVLFVCLGNICRSPLAEGAFTAAAASAGLGVAVDSAGTGDWHLGHPPDPRAQAVARAHGIDIAHLRARQVTPEDFRRFTHIVAMDSKNLAALSALRPQDGEAELAAFMDFAPELGLSEVPDPYYGDEKDFDETWRLVRAAAEGLVRHLKR